MTLQELYGKLFVKSRFFTIAIRKRQERSILVDESFCAEFVMLSTRQEWFADPILIDDGEKTYLFYEAVVGDKGHIEVAEVGVDCSVRNVRIVLKDACHYSYPFVFRYKGLWYMIPESSQTAEVRLYQSVRFPNEWRLSDILLYGRLVDTTVIEYNNQLILLTYELSGNSERVIPHAYRMEIENDKGKLEEIKWKNYNELRVRGAGPALEWNKEIYRPAQISQEYRYGDAVIFNRINMNKEYQEEPVSILKAGNLKIPGYYVDGLHTYTRSQRYEAIDVRVCVRDYMKPVKKLLRIIKR